MMAAVDVAVPTSLNSSYLAHQGDDLGKPIVLHKPLCKGEHTQMTLSKVFDDPGMRPKVFGREPVNKPLSALNTSDIWGAQAKPKPKARDTNPAVPVYVLPSADPAGTNLTFSGRPWSARAGRDQQAPSMDAPASTTRDTIGVADIEGTRPKAQCRPLSAQPLSTFSTDASDIEGSRPGWKPHHRAHVGANLRDPGLDVSDINNYHLPISHKTLFKGQQDAEQQRYHQQQRQQQQQQLQLQLQLQQQQQQQQQQQGLPEGFVYTGLPAFQSPPAPGEAWGPAPRTMSPGDAETMQLVQEQQAGRHRADAEQQAASQSRKVTHSASVGHRMRVGWAEEREAARQAANDAVSQLELGRAGVEVLWNTLKASDRQGSGRVTIAELVRALDVAGVQRSPEQLKVLVIGLQDNAGLLPYRELSKVLLTKSLQPGADPKLFPTWSTGRARPSSARPAAGAPAPAKAAVCRPSSARPTTAAAAAADPAATSTTAPMHWHMEPAPFNPAPAATGPESSSGNVDRQAGAAEQPQWQPQQQQQQRQQQQQDAVRYAGAASGPGGSAPSADPYWFGGADSPQALQQGAADWTAKQDNSHAATAYHVREDAASAAAAATSQSQDTAAARGGQQQDAWSGYASPSAAHVRDTHTTSSLLKSGKLTGGQLAEQLKAKHSPARAASASRARPGSAILPSSGMGVSHLLTLKGTLVPVGTGGLQVAGMAPRPAAGLSRPASATRPTSAAANVSFSAAARHGASNMEKLNRQMLRSEIAAVRLLF